MPNGTENDKKEEVVNTPAVRVFDLKSGADIITNIGYERGSKLRYEIIFPVPKTDEAAKERYDCTLADLISSGVRQFSTRPAYKPVGWDDKGNLLPGGHEAMQKVADTYKPGQRVAGGGQKAKLAAETKRADSAENTIAEQTALIEKLKSQVKNRK